MRGDYLGFSLLTYIYVCLLTKFAEAACSDNQATCQAGPCNGYWDATNSICYICSTDQPTCETNCQMRWIKGACVNKCTNAVSQSDCNACYGLWKAGTSTCIDCMQDQSYCVDQCSRYWIGGKCWDCAKDNLSCIDSTTCKGEWTGTTCMVCWETQAGCQNCNRYWDSTAVAPAPNCINCQLDQPTCETANKCNGYWNGTSSTCTVCSLNYASCQSQACGGVWNSLTNTCVNCLQDQRQCTNCHMDWITAKCVNCQSGFNTCTSIDKCNGQWSGSACTICNFDSATCQGAICNGTWVNVVPATLSYCNMCSNNAIECAKCNLNWIPGIPNTCLNCNKDQPTCENTAGCNGVWNIATLTCNICNQDSQTCSTCPQLRRWDPVAVTYKLCLNCFTDSVQCGKCQYFYIPNNVNYDIGLQQTCVNCSSSEDFCTSKLKCNGFWDTNLSVCTDWCNKSSTDCGSGQCLGSWDATNLLCNVCSKTQAECNICGRQWVINQCVNCQLNSATCTNKASCGGIWQINNTCLVCNENSTSCKACGGFWKNSQCYQCDASQIDCVSCGGIYDNTKKQCILENDFYSCSNQLKAYFQQPYWNGILCVDCNASQQICNKECFRVWSNQSCSNVSCDTDQVTCESACFHQWNYYQQKCFSIDINENNVCTIENDSVILNGQCIECHASQDLCEVQCNQAYTPNGLRVWNNNKCTDCQADQITCTTVCQMNWITITVGAQTKNVCIKCNLDQYNCSMCQGQWTSNPPAANTCTNIQSFCNQSSTNCLNICAFIPTKEFNYVGSNCYYCNLNQFSCETGCNSLWMPRLQFCEILSNQDACQLNNRGVWDSAAGICRMCNANQASCLACKSDNTWDPIKLTCLNINLGQQYCTGENYLWVTDALSSTYSISLANGRCISCNINQNVCEQACKRKYSGGQCLACNSSQAVCTTNCGKDWIPPSTCVVCSSSQDVCVNTCNWYWDSVGLTCINCNASQAACQNASLCNGSWDGTANTCNLCNQSVANCEQKCFFVYSSQTSSCINCQSSLSACQQSCGYIWDPTLATNQCILCNQSKAICEATGTYKCNGFWLATNKCTQFKCNQDQTTCQQKCLMLWNSKLQVCQKCSQTQYQDASGNCIECSTLVTSLSCATNCAANQFFWDTAAAKCRQCTATEYWDTNQCKSCTAIHVKCQQCQIVTGVATCLSCLNNYRVQSATVCSCDSDRIPNASNVCTLCSTLIANCSLCSVLAVCATCNQGYSWDSVNKVCRAKLSFTSNTLSGIAFVTDFTLTLSYPNAYNPTNAPIVYAIYLYDTITDYNNELSNFLLQKITVGVLYQANLAQNSNYSLKLKSGNPVLAPLLILNGQVIPPEDQVLVFTVQKQFNYMNQFTKYINQMMGVLVPQSFYYKMYTDELINQYYQNSCSNCPTGVTCIANTNQCNCATLATGMTLYDCSGLDNTQFDLCVTNLFSYFKNKSTTDPQSLQKVKDLLIQLNTVGNQNMNVDLFQYYTNLIPVYVGGKPNPTLSDIMNYIDIIRKVVTYTDYMMQNSLATTASQIYKPHDQILTAITAVLNIRSSYTLETLKNARLTAGAFASINSLITTLDMQKMEDATGGVEPTIYGSSSDLVIGGNVKVSRFFYKLDPFFIGNSTFSSYKNYPFVEYIVNQKSGTTYVRSDIDFTFIFTVADIKQSIKCAQREGDFLQLCSKTDIDTNNLKITCSCKNSGTLIEKNILVEPPVSTAAADDHLLYIILGATLGGALIIFLASLFIYLKKQKLDDKYKILKKQKDGTRAIDPNLSLSDYDLEITE